MIINIANKNVCNLTFILNTSNKKYCLPTKLQKALNEFIAENVVESAEINQIRINFL